MTKFSVHKPEYTQDEYKELSAVTSYIVSYDLFDLGHFEDSFEAGWEAAKSFLKEYPEGTEFPHNGKNWDETVEIFAANYVME